MKWSDAREAALERAGHCCEVCRATCSANHRPLHVHHRDEDQQNNDPANLQALCAACHRREHARRKIAAQCTRSEHAGHIYRARRLGKVSIQELAKRTGFSAAFIQRVETNQRPAPDGYVSACRTAILDVQDERLANLHRRIAEAQSSAP